MRNRVETGSEGDFSTRSWGKMNVCRHCHYVLTGLAEHGNCPECGRPFGVQLIVYGCRRFHGWWKIGVAVIVACWLMRIWYVMSAGVLAGFLILSSFTLFVLGLTIRRELRRIRIRQDSGGDYRWLIESSGICFEGAEGDQEHYTPWRDIERIIMNRTRGSTRFRIEEKGRPFKKIWFFGVDHKDDLRVDDLDGEQATRLLQEIRSHQKSPDA